MVKMVEKGRNGSRFFRLNSWLSTGISSLTGALLAAVILLGILDSGTIDSGIEVWDKHRDYLGIHLGIDEHLTHSGTPQTRTALNLNYNVNPQIGRPSNPDPVETPSEQELQQEPQTSTALNLNYNVNPQIDRPSNPDLTDFNQAPVETPSAQELQQEPQTSTALNLNPNPIPQIGRPSIPDIAEFNQAPVETPSEQELQQEPQTSTALNQNPNANPQIGRLSIPDLTDFNQAPVKTPSEQELQQEPQTSAALNLNRSANPQIGRPSNPDLTDFNQAPVETPSEQELQQEEQHEIVSWISIPPESNQTGKLLARLAQHSSVRNKPCYGSHTATIRVPGLEGGKTLELSAGKIHRFAIFAYDEAGKARCSGGDYFETDLSSKNWKSRPPVKDLGNGSYTLAFQVHPDFAGDYVLRIILLFRSYLGLKQLPKRWVIRKELLNVMIKFRRDRYRLEPLTLCQKGDFQRDFWSGRWTHHGPTTSCKIDNTGRFRCLKGEFACEKPWCEGNLGSIESTGWVYSTHCSFRIFTGDAAWDCLQNRWLFFWGDSNHVDSTRNLLNFVLGRWDIKTVPRRFDLSFKNPANSSQAVRITSVFNGHWNATNNYGGLNSLRNKGFQELLRSYFTGKTLPDVMIMNSGLHDGFHWRRMEQFSEAAAFAASFWKNMLSSPGNRKPPQFIFRSTVAAAGYARARSINPQKMEAYNALLLEQFRRKGLVSGVVDDFDLTYPWHYDHNCSDGAHYGRPPIKAKWHGQVGHQYFVDLMLIHVLLNQICPIS